MASDASSIPLAMTKQTVMLARVKRLAFRSARFAALRSIVWAHFVFGSGKELVTDNLLLVEPDQSSWLMAKV
jgi:hypothetical protein